MTGEWYEVDLDVEESMIVQFPDKVETGGIASCMGVGILNHRKRKGYLGHYNYLDDSSEALMNEAISEATHIGDLEVVLAGNIPSKRTEVALFGGNYEETLESFRAHGRWALQMVRSKGIKRIQNHLQNDPVNIYYDILIDTEKRTIEAQKKEIEEEYEPADFS